MALFNANLILRELRKTRGLTQEQLAEGICSRSTITMIEQGKRRPDWWTFKQLAAKLGIEPEQYFNDIANEDEVYVYNKYAEISKLNFTQDFDAMKLELSKLETDERFNKEKGSSGYRLLLNLKIIYNIDSPNKDLDVAIECCMERLRLFRPTFELAEIESYVLTSEELNMIDCLLEAYALLGRYDEVIEYRKKILANFERNYVAMTLRVLGAYAWSISFFAHTLLRAGRYVEAVEAADKGMGVAFGEFTLNRQFQECMRYKAKALMKLGDENGGHELMKRHLAYLYGMSKDEVVAEYDSAKKDFETEFGCRLELDLP